MQTTPHSLKDSLSGKQTMKAFDEFPVFSSLRLGKSRC